MEDKTKEFPQKETKMEAPRQTAQERIADIITASLERAKANGGIFLNATQKTKPGIYNSAMQQPAFNKALIAMHSDQNDFKTNLVTFFSEAKKRGESVRGGQKGLPLPWYSWTNYQKKDDPDVTVSRSDYMAMPKEEQLQYKGIRNKEMRIVFNIDQTTMPSVNKDVYAATLEKDGSVQERSVDANTDQTIRVVVNDSILNLRDNLVSIRSDGSGVASYDKSSDSVHIPAQNTYDSYPEYVQDVMRQVVAATAHPQRLNRISTKNYDTLVTEIASATKQLDYGMPAKLSPKAMENVDALIEMLKKNPTLVDSIEKDVNSAMNMIQKAERGEKIEKRPTEADMERWHAGLPKEGTTPDRFDAVLMMKDLEGKWALMVKPENEKIFAVHPTTADTTMFFNTMRGATMESTEAFRTEMAQKYYAEVAEHPEKAVDVFGENMDKANKDALQKVIVYKTKEEQPKIMIYPTLTTGDKLKPRELSQEQWQMMWLAPDMKDFKKTLAATIFKDEIAEKMQQAQNKEQNTELKEPVTLDIPKWSLNYIINGDADGLSDKEKEIVDKFLDENFADGFIPEVIEGNDKEFNVSPAFGTRNPNALPDKGESPYQAVDTAQVKFSPAGYFETRNEDNGKKNDSEEKSKTYDPEAFKEDKECAKLLKNIEKLDKKCRAETQPNRQRALFEEKKALETKLQDRMAMLQKQADQKKENQDAEQKGAAETKAKKPKKSELSPLLKQYIDLKSKHPDALLLFRTGDFYETYKDDAKNASKVLGITLTKSSKVKDDEGKPLAMAGFPYHALDAYLPKLIRAGHRVAICDQIEAPRQTIKRGETAPPEQQEKNADTQKEQKTEQEETHSRGFHR